VKPVLTAAEAEIPGRKIMVVNPNTTVSMTDMVVAAAQRVAAPGTRVVGGTATRGVDSVESNLDEVWGALGVVEQVGAGEEQGVDGYVIACFGDTGLAAAKEIGLGPAVGMTEAALFTAALVATRFCVVTLPPRTREQSHRVLRETGLAGRCTVRAIDVRVSELTGDPGPAGGAGPAGGSGLILDAMRIEADLALAEDAAEAIVLGCAGLAHLVEPLQQHLGVPVIDGVAAGLKMVEGLLALGLSTSRAGTYARPRRAGG
jgi:allantoin racemase